MKKSYLAILLPIMLSACGSFHDEALNQERPEIDHRIGVHPVQKHLEFETDKNGNVLGNPASLQAFAVDYARRGHGPLSLSGNNQSILKAKEVLMRFGVHSSQIVTEQLPESEGISMSFSAFSVVPPQCGLFTDDDHLFGLGNPSNKTTINYGCTTQKNMALMLQDPLDVIRMRGPASPSFSDYGYEQRVNALHQYQAPPAPVANEQMQ